MTLAGLCDVCFFCEKLWRNKKDRNNLHMNIVISGDLEIKTKNKCRRGKQIFLKKFCIIRLSYLSRKINFMHKELLYCKCGRLDYVIKDWIVSN